MRYTNRRYLYLYLDTHVSDCRQWFNIHIPDFSWAAGVNTEQKATDDSRLECTDDDDITTFRQGSTN